MVLSVSLCKFLRVLFFISVTNSVVNNVWRFTILRLTSSCVNFNQERVFFTSDMQQYLHPLFLIVAMATCSQLIRLFLNETNLVHVLFLVYFVNFFITSTCFGPPQVHHQEGQLYKCDTWYLTLWYAGCIPDSQLYSITSTKCRINTVVPPDDGPREVRNM